MPTKAIRQLSPSNPYLAANSRFGGYTIEVEPKRVATGLMERREQLAVDWSCSLGSCVFVSGNAPYMLCSQGPADGYDGRSFERFSFLS